MNIQKDLFQLKFINKIEDSYNFECFINENNSIFSGHFPDMPIVPGVCLINALKQAVCEVIGKDVSFLKIRECKFLSAINPTKNNKFLINFILSDENEIKAGIFVDKTQCVKLKATLSC